MPEASTFRIIDHVPWIGERSFPWRESIRVEDVQGAGYDWRSRGFYLTFENGYTLSVQWGMGTYCVNHDAGFARSADSFRQESPDAEIALWNLEGTWFDWGGNTVKGWCSVDDVLAVIKAVATWPTSEFGPNPLKDGDDE